MKYKSWNDVTLKQFYEIQDLLSMVDEYTTFNLLDVVYEIDSSEMTLNEVSKYAGALDFLDTDIQRVKLDDKYVIGDTEYTFSTDLAKVTTAQYVDYTSYTKKDNVKYEELLSVFFIPVGHTYNDGYDLSKVKEDMLQLPITVVYTSAFFFAKQLAVFVKYFQRYLTQTLKGMKVKDMKKKQAVIDLLQAVDFSNLVSYHLY